MSRFTTFGLTILLAFAPAALAVDGTVLINQSTITNGLTGCPTGGHFPIIICQAGSYRLSGNLTVPDASTLAINISADNVSIDLNGFSIIGPVVCSGGPLAIVCSPSSNVGAGGISSSNSRITISNGTIQGTGFIGISLRGAGNRIVNVQAYSNADTGIFAGPGSIVTSSIAIYNRGSGFVVFQGTVSGNIAVDNGGNGIQADVDVSTIFDNVMNHNGGSGIIGWGTIRGNTSVANGGAGIAALCPSLVIANSANFNPSGNIFLSPVTGCTVLDNNAP